MRESPSPEKMAEYRRSAERRHREAAQRAAEKRTRAWAVAREAARILKGEFGARKVVAFGSIVGPERFHLRSDVDLAAWGLGERVYLRAVARLLSLDPEFQVDLVRAESARPLVAAAIERSGVPL